MVVLMPHCGFLSETSRMLHIAQALRARGHPVALATHGGPYARVLDDARMPYTRLDPAPVTMPIPGTEWLPRVLKRKMANSAVERMTDPVKFLNVVAAELGVEPVPSLAALMLADLTLVTDVPEVLGVSATQLESWRPSRPRAARRGPEPSGSRSSRRPSGARRCRRSRPRQRRRRA